MPSSWTAGRASDNGDGIEFTAPDGRAKLAVYGSNNMGTKLKDEAASSAEFASSEGFDVSYAPIGRNWFVVSGKDSQGTILYEKVWFGPGSTNTLYLTYPASQQATIEPVLKRMLSSFDPGDLAAAH